MKKATRIQKLEQELKKAKNLVEEFKKRNGNASLRISNKDILLLLLNKSTDTDKRVGRIEGILKVLIPIVLAGIGLNVTGVI